MPVKRDPKDDKVRTHQIMLQESRDRNMRQFVVLYSTPAGWETITYTQSSIEAMMQLIQHNANSTTKIPIGMRLASERTFTPIKIRKATLVSWQGVECAG